jgi:hypothetical protein
MQQPSRLGGCGRFARRPGSGAGHAHGAYLLRTNCTEQDPAKL